MEIQVNFKRENPDVDGRIYPAQMQKLIFQSLFKDSALTFSSTDEFIYLLRTNGKAVCFIFERPSTPLVHKWLDVPNNVGPPPIEDPSTFYAAAYNAPKPSNPPVLSSYPDQLLDTLATEGGETIESRESVGRRSTKK